MFWGHRVNSNNYLFSLFLCDFCLWIRLIFKFTLSNLYPGYQFKENISNLVQPRDVEEVVKLAETAADTLDRNDADTLLSVFKTVSLANAGHQLIIHTVGSGRISVPANNKCRLEVWYSPYASTYTAGIYGDGRASGESSRLLGQVYGRTTCLDPDESARMAAKCDPTMSGRFHEQSIRKWCVAYFSVYDPRRHHAQREPVRGRLSQTQKFQDVFMAQVTPDRNFTQKAPRKSLLTFMIRLKIAKR